VTISRDPRLGFDERRAERLASLGTLASGLAHEIRNPLNSALLQLKVLERRVRNPDGADALGAVAAVRSELVRIEHLLADFLAFAEPMRLDLAAVELNALLAGFAARVTASAAEAGAELELELELDPQVGTVELDAARLCEVLSALVDNALEAMPEGGKLWIRSHGPDADGFVSIEVEDTGLGFGPEAPVFDPFYTTKPSGTGLGLSIAHRVLSDHGGWITSRSADGRTLFSLCLPVVRPAQLLRPRGDR
jgi:signal transduction histidine kinase